LGPDATSTAGCPTHQTTEQPKGETTQVVATQPLPRFLKKGVDKPPNVLIGGGINSGAIAEEDDGGTKELTRFGE